MSEREPKSENDNDQHRDVNSESRKTPASGVGHTPSQAEGDEATVDEALRNSET